MGKQEYIDEMKATSTLCGINAIADKSAPIDKDKACSELCLPRAESIVAACDTTGVGGDGKEVLVNLIKKSCNVFVSFVCKTKQEYIDEMKATYTSCGINATADKSAPIIIDKDKACSELCLPRAESIVAACDTTGVGGDGKEVLVNLIKKTCNSSISKPTTIDMIASSCTLVTPGVFVLIFAAVLQL